MKLRNKLPTNAVRYTGAAAALYLGSAAASFASSGLPMEAQLLPFGNFVLLWAAFILLGIALVVAGLRWAFAAHIGEAGRTIAQWLIGAALIGGGISGGAGWIMSQFGLSQGAIF